MTVQRTFQRQCVWVGARSFFQPELVKFRQTLIWKLFFHSELVDDSQRGVFFLVLVCSKRCALFQSLCARFHPALSFIGSWIPVWCASFEVMERKSTCGTICLGRCGRISQKSLSLSCVSFSVRTRSVRSLAINIDTTVQLKTFSESPAMYEELYIVLLSAEVALAVIDLFRQADPAPGIHNGV